MACALLAVATCVLSGCNGTSKPDEEIPLPTIGGNEKPKPRGVFAIIRRVDVPMDQSTDEAWAITNEQVVPALTRGAWRGNGMRLGILESDQLDAYAEAMPQPVGFGETLINQSPHPIPIIETAHLPGDLRFRIDLTRPPMPPKVETIVGGKDSTLRMLARIETEDDGRHTIVLTPQHHIPSPFGLIPRDPLEKELDGRLFNELTVRVTLEPKQVAVVGLYWPWPMREVLPDEAGADGSGRDTSSGSRPLPVPPPDSSDPAAPPRHITGGEQGETTEPEEDNDETEEPETADPQPRQQRVAPALTTHFGSRLFTGMRIRKPVQKVLLITIEEPVVTNEPETP